MEDAGFVVQIDAAILLEMMQKARRNRAIETHSTNIGNARSLRSIPRYMFHSRIKAVLFYLFYLFIFPHIASLLVQGSGRIEEDPRPVSKICHFIRNEGLKSH